MPDPSSSPDDGFAAHFDVIALRYARALHAEGYAGVLLYSGAPTPVFEDDQSAPYRVNAPFKTWAPLTDAPDCFLYFEPGRVPVLLFHQAEDFWHKQVPLPQGSWARHFHVRPVPSRAAVRALLPQSLARVAYLGEPFAELASWGVSAINPRRLMTRLDFGRAAKTPYELGCLRRASELGARGHLAAARAFAAGASEFEIELAFLKACGQREQELPYNPIIALNEGAATLHYQVLQRQPPPQRHSMLIDAGCDFHGYASDITRTYSHADADFAALVQEMDELQQSLCASVRAGVDWRDIHMLSHRLVAELLHSADVIKCDADEALGAGLSSVFLPHGIGHLLGLQVHDVGGLLADAGGGESPRPEGHPFLRLTRVLEEGFVVTMEPGIYFIDQLLEQARSDARGQRINWPRVEQLRKFGGIRIEDNLAVTATGSENFTRDAFQACAATPG
jgi:Xaa-Pro dipeptidase